MKKYIRHIKIPEQKNVKVKSKGSRMFAQKGRTGCEIIHIFLFLRRKQILFFSMNESKKITWQVKAKGLNQ
jgi:hypothetical protein